MKKLLVLLAAMAVGNAYADDIDLINTHVTCGSYILTPSSAESDIVKNCKMQELEKKKHIFRTNETVLEFATDQYKLVKCEFKKGSLDDCKVKQK